MRCVAMKHASARRHACAAALCLALPSAGLAQPQAEGRLDAITGGYDGDRAIPEVYWEEEMQGLYAIDGACDDPDAVWAFALDTVDMGRTICTFLGKMTFHEGWLHVPAGQCSRMGESVDSIWIALREEEDGVLSARIGDADEVVRLISCPHPGE